LGKTFPEQLTRLAALAKHYDVSTDYLIEAVTALRDKAIILTLLDTGIRASELCNLSYNDFDAANGRLTIQHGKGDKARIVYVGETTQRIIWRLLVGRKSGALFATRTGEPLNRSNLRKLIVRLADRAGVRNASVHRFRHTFAVSFLRNGGNVFALQEILGHARIDTVKIYVRLAERDLADAQRRASPVDNWRL
jgi:integrase/recombinase XerD